MHIQDMGNSVPGCCTFRAASSQHAHCRLRLNSRTDQHDGGARSAAYFPHQYWHCDVSLDYAYMIWS